MTDLLRSLLETRSTLLADVDGDRLLVRSDLSGTMQLYELDAPGRPLRPLTDLPDPVGAAAYVPGSRRAVVQMDTGGDERHQLHLLDLDDGSIAALTTDRRYGHHLAGVDPAGAQVAYVSDRSNGVDFDLWLCDLATGEHRLLHETGSWSFPASGFSPDGRWVSVLTAGARPLDLDLRVVEVATGAATVLLAHPDAAAEVGPPVWLDATTVAVGSNVGTDRSTVVVVDVVTGASAPLAGAGAEWDVTAVDGDAAGVVTVESVDGASVVRVVDPASGAASRVPLPDTGSVMSHALPRPRWSRGRVYLNLSTVRQGPDVWVHDPASGTTERATTTPAAVDPGALAEAETASVTSFDGEEIHLRFVRPPGAAPGARPPVVLVIHGGPESQSQPAFNPVVQALALSGFGVVIPNVRGSTGYGKRFAGLDDTTKRLDSVRDLAAVHGWLAGAGFDPERAALYGGSYGGYMVLAGLAFQPELWAAGVDIVGISDLVTFLENTSAYRRAYRELEYGSLEHDREFLASASPLRHADAIRAPLLMIHGRNDPRVPVGETEQLAAVLGARGVRCELVIYEDEGHGLARLANRVDAYPRALAFLTGVLRPGA